MNSARMIQHSARTLSRYKLRSGFMILATLVGVAALTLVVSLGQGAERKLLSTVRQLFGSSSIMIIGGGSRLMGGPHGPAQRLTLDDIEAVVKELRDEIEMWDPQQVLSRASLKHGDANTTARIIGASERAPRVWDRKAARGEYFDAATVKSSAREALIGETVARELFAGQDPLGAEMLIESVPFRIIGILETFGTDIHGMDRDNEVVIPISTMMRRVMNVDTIGAAKLIVKDESRSEETAREIRRLLREQHKIAEGQPSDFSVITPVEIQEMVRWAQRILDLYLPLIAGISLLVAAIVGATLMLASVNGRLAEIGLRRAVGARSEDIGLQFLIETVVTTFVGGVLGIATGYLVAGVVALHVHLDDILSWRAVALGVGSSIATGLLAGVLPARRAARLDPVKNLR